MTAQIPEKLFYNGNEYDMCTEPLRDYLSLTGISISDIGTPHLHICSALWRGYVGVWEIVDGRLYLIKIDGSEIGQDYHLEDIFPGFPDRVFAHWFSDEISIPQGKMLKYVHGGYLSRYERDLILEFRKGVLINETIINNARSNNDDIPES